MTAVPAGLATALQGRYRIERELGAGGMATVFLAHDLKHHRDLALKVLRPELAAVLGRERFLAEIHLTAKLDHPHILTLIDSGESDGFLWYVVPFIRGESLRQKLEREKQLGVDEAVAITKQVAGALDYAHRQGVIHRDIKPENILLHEGEAMLADFGIALAVREAAGERLTETGLSVGTPQYMSPEQATAERQLDARSDVYSLGAVLYEMLAGEPPFTGATGQAVIAKLMTIAALPLSVLRPAIPPWLNQAVLRSLAKTPADRFPTTAEFAAALSAATGGQPTPSASVAVLPFQSLSINPEHELFADGITEDVIAQLSKIRSLKVISRNSVMPFKKRDQSRQEISATLHVATLLEGSVRQAGDRVRIVAQLIDAEEGHHLWAETYDRQLTDVFAIQTDVALQIAAALKAELSPDEQARIRKEPTSSVHAYQLYLQGRHCYSRYTEAYIQKGIEYFRQAIAADPGFALAHVGLAVAYAEISAGAGGTIRPDLAFQESRDAVTRALALDSSLGEAHSVLATLKFVHDFDWSGAEAGFKLALELSPGAADIYDHYGWLCSALGRHDEALALVAKAQELDPLMHRADVATELLRAGRHQEALQAALRCVEFEPGYPRGRSTLGWAYLKNGLVEEGLAQLKQSVALAPEQTIFLAQLGEAYGLAGQLEKAREILQRLEDLSRRQYVSPYHIAYVQTGLGQQEAALDMLERAYEEQAGSVYGLKGSFLFTSLHSHPRFKALLRRMHLA